MKFEDSDVVILTIYMTIGWEDALMEHEKMLLNISKAEIFAE